MNTDDRQNPDQSQQLSELTLSELDELDTQQTYLKAYQSAEQRLKLFLTLKEGRKRRLIGRNFWVGTWQRIKERLGR